MADPVLTERRDEADPAREPAAHERDTYLLDRPFDLDSVKK
ncbi:hypothetical protein [Methylobacterium oryzisoli]